MPWEVTDQYIRSGHRSPPSGGKCRTITISSSQGIKAVYCDYGGKWAIQSYLFSKSSGWTLSKAKSWFSDHNENLCESLKTASFHFDFSRIFDTFIKHFGEEEGEIRFKYFVSSNNLDPTKRYHPLVQFHESVETLYENFGWVKPLIRFIRQDEYAKYYAVTCITANISMNNRPYPASDLKPATISMHYRPINMNHDHAKWVSFPRTRIEWAKFEDNALEGLLRVDNQDKWLQTKLDNHEILHPSIECRPIPAEIGGGLHFTALALLEKGKQLPGDPLTDIQPVMLNESIQNSFQKLIDGGEIPMNEEKKRTEEERAMSHFNIPADEWNKLSDSEKKVYLDKLPPRGTAESSKAEQTLNGEKDNTESSESSMSENTSNSEETGDGRAEKLKMAELETTNKLLQEEIDTTRLRYEELKKESRKKITTLEQENADLKTKASLVEGMTSKMGEKEKSILQSEKTIKKLNETITEKETEIGTLKELHENKNQLIENLRADIKDLQGQINTAKESRKSAELAKSHMEIDLKTANEEAAAAKIEANEASEKYTDTFNKLNEQIQKTGDVTRKYNIISEEVKILREQATKDGEMIESMKRNSKIMEKKIDRYEKDRNERMQASGEIEVADPTKVTPEELAKSGLTLK